MDFTNIDYMLSLNRFTPIVAIFLTLIALFSKKYITRDCVSSSIMHLTILLWTMLIWADWGSEVFRPSRQTIVARCLMVVILGLVVLLIRNYSKIFRRMKSDNQALADENKQLKKLLHEEIIQGGCNENK